MTAQSTITHVGQRKPPKRLLSVRVTATGYAHIAARAARSDVDVSHMVRRMLAYAAVSMPEGWVPSRRPAMESD